MRAKVNIKLEIIDGNDAGYILEETDRIVHLERPHRGEDMIEPYRIILDFVTPDIMREYREREQFGKLESLNPYPDDYECDKQ